jgi:hypothetical protein
LLFSTHEDTSKLWEIWQKPEKLDLGKWQILMNEAQNFTILDEYRNNQK